MLGSYESDRNKKKIELILAMYPDSPIRLCDMNMRCLNCLYFSFSKASLLCRKRGFEITQDIRLGAECASAVAPFENLQDAASTVAAVLAQEYDVNEDFFFCSTDCTKSIVREGYPIAAYLLRSVSTASVNEILKLFRTPSAGFHWLLSINKRVESDPEYSNYINSLKDTVLIKKHNLQIKYIGEK